MHIKYIRWILFVMIGLTTKANAQSADINSLSKKLYELCLRRDIPVDNNSHEPIASILQAQQKDGSWADINYHDSLPARWQPALHLQRLTSLAIAYQAGSKQYLHNEQLLSAIRQGISYWVDHTPVSTNYWWNAIGAPNLLGSICILMQENLDSRMLDKAVHLIKLGVKPDYYDYFGKATGQNLLWLASAHLYASCLSKDTLGIARVFRSVAEEIIITDKEGIQVDYSFYQHGNQNYALGYGKGFAASAARFFYLADHTAWQFAKDKIDILSKYILNGIQWMFFHQFPEYTAMGREISRETVDLQPLLQTLDYMMVVDAEHKEAYLQFFHRLDGTDPAGTLSGNRYFPRADLMIQQRNSYYFSVKAASNRIRSSETGNGENIKGYYLGNGTQFIVRRGDEYKGIFPLWNWRQLPGLLCSQINRPLPLIPWGSGSIGATSFVYGLSDGQHGCFGYDYNKDGVSAHRSWFMFDKLVVQLVSNAHGDSLRQSINQCYLRGPVWQKKEDGLTRVFHDSIGYLIQSASPVIISKEKRTAAWKDINLSESAEKFSREIFYLGIDLGASVSDQSYAYAFVPGIDLASFKKYSPGQQYKILQNSDSIQAVWEKNNDEVQAVCYSSGTLALPWLGLQLQFRKAGLTIIHKKGNILLIHYRDTEAARMVTVPLKQSAQEFENDCFLIHSK